MTPQLVMMMILGVVMTTEIKRNSNESIKKSEKQNPPPDASENKDILEKEAEDFVSDARIEI